MYDNYFQKVKQASRSMPKLDAEQTEMILKSLSKAILVEKSKILEANLLDLNKMDKSDPRYDRLKLSRERLELISHDLVSISELPVPVGESLEKRTLANGLNLEKVRVPLGVIGIIYEARPNVTIDVFALCLRSGNACVLKGGSDAENSNTELVRIIKNVLKSLGVDPDIIQLLPSDRLASTELMNAVGKVDVLIPRGSQSLINSVRDNAKIPVIETGAGIVHTYFDKSADLDTGKKIVLNAKTRRVSVCNALDCLLIHSNRINDLPILVHELAKKQVQIYADERAYNKLDSLYPKNLLEKAKPEDFGTEFLDYKMSIKTIDTLTEALDHIYKYSSKHSEAIIATDADRIERYLNEVDAAALYVNSSTAFTDGAQFGLGAEIGISTQKLHARGPMGLNELCSYKWIVRGEGQIRD
ncbi:glutamate-5-semialdehyde dehydrogenase [Carboxylicivirga sp. N1Y90]|uniref:glutamate-5-semialdehyde dehydrogenase n=1 Tax=Carboxylicivirga fragile TaxID=3417571 RepID=UPI003D328474|nr:glutamate-5-semialdehyde dehydrogenase [Marinilabiliaceae bacterium N1Y90]